MTIDLTRWSHADLEQAMRRGTPWDARKPVNPSNVEVLAELQRRAGVPVTTPPSNQERRG